MQPSDNLSFAVSKISEPRFLTHILRKEVRPSKRNVSIKSDVYGVPFAIPLGSPPSTDSHAKRNHFPRNFRAVSVGRHWRFFSPLGHLPPQPERVHTASKMRSNRDRRN